MQPSPAPRRRRRLVLIVSLIAGGTLVLCITASVIGNIIGPPPATKSAGTTPTSTVTRIAQATSTSARPTATKAPTHIIAPTSTPTHAAPTSTPTQTTVPTNTPTVATAGPALLGSNISAYIAKYGQPNDHSTSGDYHFLRYPGSNVDEIVATTTYGPLVDYLVIQAPASGWSQDQAEGTCAAFFPADATYQSQVQTSSGYDKIYFSASLANLFPASDFTDANGNQVKPGMFDVNYLVRSGSTIDSCSIIIGTQQTK